MRQAVLVEPKHIEFREVEAPKASDLKEHQVLLNIKRIGICGSEIHSYHGCHPATFYPVVQGHEYSSFVVKFKFSTKFFSFSLCLRIISACFLVVSGKEEVSSISLAYPKIIESGVRIS